MKRYRKKPVVVEAVQLTIENLESGALDHVPGQLINRGGRPYLEIHTLEGTMLAAPGDWIIRGVAGEFYPCKPDVFEQTYEPVED